jgi:hypothetical protein
MGVIELAHAARYLRRDSTGGVGRGCFDVFLEKALSGSRRKAYYLMSIRDPATTGNEGIEDLKEVGWAKGIELAKIARRIGGTSIVQPGCTRCTEPVRCRKKTSRRGGEGTDGAGDGTAGDSLLQALPVLRNLRSEEFSLGIRVNVV